MDEQLNRIQSLLPQTTVGRPSKELRQNVNGILWILRTGAPWRDLPDRYGKWQTVYSRFYRWQQSGVWDRLFAAVQQDADAQGRMQWDVHFVDSTIIRAHQHAAGSKKRIRAPKL
jgi:transposase